MSRQNAAAETALLFNFLDMRICSGGVEGLGVLTPRGKILAALLQHDSLSVKDIPHLTGVSSRTCFAQLRDLEGLGVIEKSPDPSYGRRWVVQIDRKC